MAFPPAGPPPQSLRPNLYAPPTAPLAPSASGHASTIVEGNRLRLPLGLPLPNLCVKCGRADGLTIRPQPFRWVSPWTSLFLVFGVLPGVVLQSLLTKRVRLSLPICPSCDSRWSRANLASKLALYGPLAIAAAGGVLGALASWGPPIAVVTFLLLLPALLIGPAVVHFFLVRPRSLRTTRIDSDAITLVGLSQSVLDAARIQRGPLM
jgi:hypothetical protein